jgi:hypothetical protein
MIVLGVPNYVSIIHLVVKIKLIVIVTLYMFQGFSAAVSSATEHVVNIGSKVMYLAGKRSNKAKLILNHEIAISPRLTHCFTEDINSGIDHPEGMGYKFPYILNSVNIKNAGRIAAEYCEGFIVAGNTRERLPWSGISGRARIEIFPGKTMQLDVCAMLYLNPIEFNRINQTFYDSNKLSTLASQWGIPQLISPSELGMQSPPSLNKSIKATPYNVEVNYKSTDMLRIPVLVNSRMDDVGIFMSLRT